MIPVEGLSSGFYLIGETEITGALYNRVINSSSTSTSQYPAVGLYYSEFISFISNLNGLTGLNFNLPSKTQWEYAAKGGKYSMGFTYSGSDIPDDVAWYSSNSGGSSHIVKQKSPNELGIYDMSGNVAEFVLKERAASTTYWYWYRMGGSYSSASPSVGSKSNSYSSSTSSTGHDSSVWGSDIGARLALTFN